jgi:hypothetical protein
MASNLTALRALDHLGMAGRPETEHPLRSLARKIRIFKETGLRRLPSWLREGPLSRSLVLAAELTLASVGLIAVLAFISVLPAMLFGLAVGVAVGWGAMRWNVDRLLRLPSLSRVAVFQFDGRSIDCTFSTDLPLEIGGGRSRRILVASAGAIASAVALLDTKVSQRMILDFAAAPRWLHTVITGTFWFLPFVIGLLLYSERHVQRWMARQLTRRVAALAASASTELCRSREIDGLVSGIDALSKSLKIEPPAEYRAAIVKFVQQNCAAVVLDSKCAEPFIEAIAELGRQDLANLAHALSAYQRSQGALLLARVRVQESRNPFLETQLDALESKIADLGKLLTQRRWNAFQESCTEGMEDLAAIQERARVRKEPPSVLAPGTDPYQLLGINREMPTPTIKKLRTRLAHIYHPDASEGFANAPKMAEVNAAFDAVIAARQGK